MNLSRRSFQSLIKKAGVPKIRFHDLFGIRPELTHPQPDRTNPHHTHDTEAMLLIGDKVVTAAPAADDCPHQLDLGQAWKQLTGLPFVFAVWMAREQTDLGDTPRILDDQRRRNAAQIDRIVARRAAAAGWPDELARQYLGHLLRYPVGPRELQAMQQFWSRAHELGFLPRCRPLLLNENPVTTP